MKNIYYEKQAKMRFIYNAIEQGWTVTKINDEYHFTKDKKQAKSVHDKNFLYKFIKSCLNQ